jgi:hypothetical protein
MRSPRTSHTAHRRRTSLARALGLACAAALLTWTLAPAAPAQTSSALVTSQQQTLRRYAKDT